MSGKETDSATCVECMWSASGPHSDEAGAAHLDETGHAWTLHKWEA